MNSRRLTRQYTSARRVCADTVAKLFWGVSASNIDSKSVVDTQRRFKHFAISILILHATDLLPSFVTVSARPRPTSRLGGCLFIEVKLTHRGGAWDSRC